MNVSVFIPVFNAEKFIAKTIESVLNQSFTNFELIIVDDHSSDRSYIIAQEYAEKDDRIKLYRNDANMGMMQNWNKGISLASGKYFMKLDADDIIHPDFLTNCVAILDKNPEVGLVCAKYMNIDEDGNLLEGTEAEIPAFAKDRKFDYGKLVQDGIHLFRYAVCRQGIGLIRKDLIDKVGHFLLIQPADSEYWFRLAAHSEFYCINKVMHYHRIWSGSDTQSTIRNNWGRFEKNMYDVRKAIFDYYFEQNKLSGRTWKKFTKDNEYEYRRFLIADGILKSNYSLVIRFLVKQLFHKPIDTTIYYLRRIFSPRARN